MNELLISVLIPAYNAEMFIEKSINSVINQSYSNIDIVIVEDCSEDRTKDIIKRYELKDKRIRAIYNESNQGICSTRNILIDNAFGEYIMFCDADDYLELDCIEKIVNYIKRENSDCIIFNYTLIKKGFNVKLRNKYIPIGRYLFKDFAKYHIKYPKTLFWGVLWNKCYKSEIIKGNNIRFTSQLEDVIFNLKYFKLCKNCRIIHDYLYNYNQTNISLTRKKGNQTLNKQVLEKRLYKQWDDYKEVYINFKNCYSSLELSIYTKLNLYNYLYSTYLEIENICKKNNIISVMEYIKYDKEYLDIINNLNKFKTLLDIKFNLQSFNKTVKKYIIEFLQMISKSKKSRFL